MKMEKLGFQAEVSRLLDIVAHSLYSDRAVFLRELISNASDACDKLRYLSLTEPGLIADDPEFGITVTLDKDRKTLTVSDNGIGMNREDLISHLGTIARSGSAQFVQALEEGKSKDVSLIGQFGVGFYAAFMVADQVTVVSARPARPRPGSGSATARASSRSARPNESGTTRAAAPTSSSTSRRTPRSSWRRPASAPSSPNTPITSPCPSS